METIQKRISEIEEKIRELERHKSKLEIEMKDLKVNLVDEWYQKMLDEGKRVLVPLVDENEVDETSSERITIPFTYEFTLGGYKYRELKDVELYDDVGDVLKEYLKKDEYVYDLETIEAYVDDAISDISEFNPDKANYDSVREGYRPSGIDTILIPFSILQQDFFYV